MEQEKEVTLLNVDKGNFIKKIEGLGAKKVDEFLQKRYTYDFEPVRSHKWIRLRTNGEKTTLTIKEVKDRNAIDGTLELETEVGDFDVMNKILEELGYKHRNYQENYRIIYMLDRVEISIDSWPLIPTYVEFEGKSNKDVMSVVSKVGYSMDDVTTYDVVSIYKEFYDIDILEIKELRFESENNESMLEYNK